MDVIQYRRLGVEEDLFGKIHTHIALVEIPIVAPDDLQYKVIVLDCDDSTDIAIQEPDGTREIIWSICKEFYTTEEETEQWDG